MSDALKPPMTTGATAATPPNPVIPDPRRNVPSNIFATFDANQKAQAAKVSSYLSSLQTLVGNFVQVGPDGTKTKGDFYIQKPGKVRFEYDPPTPIAIIADGSSLVVRDRNLATQDIYPLSQTPLRYLLSDRIDIWMPPRRSIQACSRSTSPTTGPRQADNSAFEPRICGG